MRLIWCALLALGLSPLTGQAELTWESTTFERDLGPHDTEVEGVYKFTNTGTKPVRILSVKTSCGCTSARPSKTEYASGESGSISAKLSLHGAQGNGRQERQVLVETDAPGQEVVTLKIAGITHQYLQLSSYYLMWDLHGAATAQKVVIDVVHKDPIRVVAATAGNPLFATTLTTVKEGRQYELTVTPPNTADKHAGNILVTTDWPAEKPLTAAISLRVRDKTRSVAPPMWRAVLGALVDVDGGWAYGLMVLAVVVLGVFGARTMFGARRAPVPAATTTTATETDAAAPATTLTPVPPTTTTDAKPPAPGGGASA